MTGSINDGSTRCVVNDDKGWQWNHLAEDKRLRFARQAMRMYSCVCKRARVRQCYCQLTIINVSRREVPGYVLSTRLNMILQWI